MSQTRNKSTSAILCKLSQSNRTQQKQTKISLDLSLKAITLFLFSQFGTAKAAIENTPAAFKTDVLHLITNTWYRLMYPTDISFTPFISDLKAACHAITSSIPITYNFTEAATPQCTWMGEPSGADVNILVQEGKELSTLFVDCINQVMEPLCDAYNEAHHSLPIPSPEDGNVDLFFSFFIPLMFALICAGLLCICCCSNKKLENAPLNNSLNNDPHDHHHSHHDNSSAGTGIASLLCCLFGMSLADANHSASSTVSSPTHYHSTNSGVSWNFANNPV